MGLPYLSKCWCLSLRMVSIIIGTFYMGIGLMYTVLLLRATIVYVDRHESISHHDKHYFSYLKELSFLYGDALQTVFSIFLVYGAYKADPFKKCYILPWLIYHCQEGLHMFSQEMCFSPHYLKHFIEDFLIIGIYALFIYVVASYYNSLPRLRILSS